MARNRWGLGALAALALTTADATAQERVLLRYHPVVGARVHTLWWSDVSTTIGVSEGSETLTLEAEALQSITRRVVQRTDSGYLVEVELDSVRARMRPAGGSWRDLAVGRGSAGLRVTVDERLRVSDVTSLRAGGDTLTGTRLQTLRGYAGGLEFGLPEEPVAAGDGWSADVVLPLQKSLALGQELNLPDELSGDTELIVRSRFTLDSIVHQPADTLAYLTLRGQVVPATYATQGGPVAGTLTITGATGGSFIWSTAWNAFVSGAVRARTTMQVQAAGTMTIRMESSHRFRVRP